MELEEGREYYVERYDEGDIGVILEITADAVKVLWERTDASTEEDVSAWPVSFKVISKAVTKFGFTTGQRVELKDTKQIGFVMDFIGNDVKVGGSDEKGQEMIPPSNLRQANLDLDGAE